MNTPRIAKSSLSIALLALVIPAAASAQATRTWVAGVGNDADPCSRTAPCKTFAGAISKTAAGGEINCLDPGDFGAVTITKAIAIKCQNTEAGILDSTGSDGILIDAGAGAKVTLRGLDIDGAGTGLFGVEVRSAGAVKIYDSEIFGQGGVGIYYHNTSGPLNRLTVARTDIHDNGGNGLVVAAGDGVVMNARVSNSEIDDNACGVVVTSTTLTSCTAGGVATTGQAAVDLFDNQIHDMRTGSGVGVYTDGSGALVRLGGNAITSNIFGIKADNPGSAGIFSFGDNYIAGNGTNGTPNGTILRTKRSP